MNVASVLSSLNPSGEQQDEQYTLIGIHSNMSNQYEVYYDRLLEDEYPCIAVPKFGEEGTLLYTAEDVINLDKENQFQWISDTTRYIFLDNYVVENMNSLSSSVIPLQGGTFTLFILGASITIALFLALSTNIGIGLGSFAALSAFFIYLYTQFINTRKQKTIVNLLPMTSQQFIREQNQNRYGLYIKIITFGLLILVLSVIIPILIKFLPF